MGIGFFGKLYSKGKNVFKGGKQKTTGEAIKSVKPAVHKSKGAQKLAETYINIGKQRGKMKRSFQKMEEDIDPARIKLRQTTQKIAGEKVTDSGISKGKDRIKKMGGGFMRKRMSFKKGSKFPDLTGDGKVTFADILKGRGVINGKKKKA